jgi:tyrosyl-tRNA synthetase
MRADIELGGTDQKFNLLVGREMQKHYGQSPQCILTMPLLEGLDGINKMSKSLGNYVGINEKPEEIFGKLMSISDDLMWRYIELLSFESLETVGKWRREVGAGRNPRDIKVAFAQEIVARFHDKPAAARALSDFEARFRQGALPEDMPEVQIAAVAGGLPLAQALKQAHLTESTSEAIRMIEQGGVRLDGERVSDRGLKLAKGAVAVAQVGKRKFARITVI